MLGMTIWTFSWRKWVFCSFILLVLSAITIGENNGSELGPSCPKIPCHCCNEGCVVRCILGGLGRGSKRASQTADHQIHDNRSEVGIENSFAEIGPQSKLDNTVTHQRNPHLAFATYEKTITSFYLEHLCKACQTMDCLRDCNKAAEVVKKLHF